MAVITPKTLPEDFFTRFDWNSKDLDVLGNAANAINEVAEENKELASGLSTLNDALATETEERKAADTTLQSNIDAETSRAEEAEQANASAITNNANAISTEETRAKAAEQANANAITSETAARTSADTELRTLINSATTDVSNLQTALTTETSNREAADTALSSRIAKFEDISFWWGKYTFASIPANATQSYAFDLDVTFDDAGNVAPYAITTSPNVIPYVVSITQTAFTLGVLNTSATDLTNVTIYAQAVGHTQAGE